MVVKLLGIKEINFANAAGERIQGTNIYVCYPEENTAGMIAERFFVRNGITIPQIKTGEEINIAFTSKGKVEAITKA